MQFLLLLLLLLLLEHGVFVGKRVPSSSSSSIVILLVSASFFWRKPEVTTTLEEMRKISLICTNTKRDLMPRDLRSTMQYTVRVLKGKNNYILRTLRSIISSEITWDQILLSNFGNRLVGAWCGGSFTASLGGEASLVHWSLILH